MARRKPTVPVVELPVLPVSRYKVIVMGCVCGHDLETDLPFDEQKVIKCSTCGATNWTLRRDTGRRIAKDPSAPTELLNALEREAERNE